ncbi:uncharacterized protein LOC113124118 isoform X2 [Mastacembelus armatus]|uniref:uncharacterized protein LOC113124118 isoform X2 n=1 Tax=Mastacembelus armatus TaxID=205130 RepID=UPI000E45D4F5|nr:uncharacterized protein LOC113124118 isoform X2 [Mastacembelus armatus]
MWRRLCSREHRRSRHWTQSVCGRGLCGRSVILHAEEKDCGRQETEEELQQQEPCVVRKINRSAVNMLRLKTTEKLMFVYQTIYNTDPVTLHSQAAQSSSFSAVCKMFFSLSLLGVKKEETSFKVPKESTFAYGLMEIATEDGTVGIPSRSWEFKRYSFGWWSISSDDGEDSCQTLRQINRELKKKAGLLRPLASLPDSTRRDLLRSLQELLQDRDDLTLLEQTLDQGSTQVSPPVSAVMDLLKASDASSSQKAALQLLVSAMDTLPDRAPALLSTCSPDVLRVLSQLVDSLQEDAQARLPESPPPPLQVDGELRWAAELLCVTDDGLRELSDQWDRPELPPGVLLELLCLVVRGLSLMQPTTHL